MTSETFALLRKIAAVSLSLQYRANWIAEDTEALVNRPDWNTKAQEELDLAEKALSEALDKVRAAKELYAKLKAA